MGDDPFVLFVGRLHEQKGVDLLLAAFEIVARRHPTVRLVIAGPDYGVTLPPLHPRVVRVGPVYGRDKPAALADATVFCLPSRHEGFSLAVLEALACGLPVVISTECHFPEVAAAGAGVVTPLDPASIADGLLRVLGDPAAFVPAHSADDRRPVQLDDRGGRDDRGVRTGDGVRYDRRPWPARFSRRGLPPGEAGGAAQGRRPRVTAAAAAAAAPLRVLHLTAGSDAGGLSRYVLDLGTAMTAAGHTVAVAGQRGPWHDLFAASPVPWVDAPLKGGPLALWRSARILARHLADHPVDLLHAHYRRAALVGRLVQRWHPVPMLYTLHLSDIPLGLGRRWLSDFGDHTHAASADAATWLTGVARVPADRITTIPHGVDPDRFTVPTDAQRTAARSALGVGPGDVLAAYVGRLEDPKNVDWLLDVVAAVPGLRLVVAGEGPHAAVLTGRDRVTLLEGRRDPVPIYHAADVLLLPSGREGFSLVCAEAMSCGVPIVRTRTAGTTETVVDGVTGWSTPISRAAFTTAAVAAVSDPGPPAAGGDGRRGTRPPAPDGRPTGAGHGRAVPIVDRPAGQNLTGMAARLTFAPL